MNNIPYEERVKTYRKAIDNYGEELQCVVALEELSECQKEICKVFWRGGTLDHLAEEVADASIMLEQVRLIFGINDLVCEKMDEKILRLQDRMEGRQHGKA